MTKPILVQEQIEYEPVAIPGGVTEYVPVAYKAVWSKELEEDMTNYHGPVTSTEWIQSGPLTPAPYAPITNPDFSEPFSVQDYVNLLSTMFDKPEPAVEGNDEDEMDPILYSAKSNNWNTPPIIFEWLKPMGPIKLDPCANATSNVPSLAQIIYINEGSNGLTLPWDKTADGKEGYVFCNPPYSKDKLNPKGIQTWIDKAVMEWNQNSVETILLVPARTDTKWFQGLMQVASACCFIKGRVGFIQETASGPQDAKAPFPSALVYLGKRSMLFCKTLDSKGWCISQ
jgi:phage N-6-adenine-methyltransferase